MRAGLPFLLMTVLGFAACNPATPLVENAIRAELPQWIGPADAYTVEIEGLRLAGDYAERVTIQGSRVRLDEAPVLDLLDVVLAGVDYDRAANRLLGVTTATATATLRPADLADFLETQDGIEEATLTLEAPDAVTLRFRPDLRGFTLPRGVAATLRGQVVAQDGRVQFEVREVRAAGLNLGRSVARRVSASINPVLDLRDTDLALTITAVRVREGRLVVEATGDPTALQPGGSSPTR